MTNASIPYLPFQYGRTLTPLEQAIIRRTDYGTINYKAFDFPEITAPLRSVANAVESAYVLVAKDDIPKATTTMRSTHQRTFHFKGDFFPLSAIPSVTAEQARKTAAKWLSISQFLDAEEKIEVKKKADADAAAKNARQSRLNDISNLYFGKDFDELGDNKASAVKEIYRLEQELADEGKDAA